MNFLVTSKLHTWLSGMQSMKQPLSEVLHSALGIMSPWAGENIGYYNAESNLLQYMSYNILRFVVLGLFLWLHYQLSMHIIIYSILEEANISVHHW